MNNLHTVGKHQSGGAHKVRILSFDLQTESAGVWRELAQSAGVHFDVENCWNSVERVPSEWQVVIVDQSVLQSDFANSISKLTLARPGQVIVATGASLSVGDVVEIMRHGCDYVFEKPLNQPLIAKVFPEILADAKRLTEKRAEFQTLRELFAELTHREEDVLQHVLKGVSNKDTAELLNVSVRTIEARRAKVYHKTHSSSVVELVRKVDRLVRLSRIFDLTNSIHIGQRHADVAGSSHLSMRTKRKLELSRT